MGKWATMLLWLLPALAATGTAQGRDLAVPEADLLTAEIAGVQAAPDGSMAAVLLRVDGELLPIFIGPLEAAAIERGRHGIRPPRPLTHELLDEVIRRAELRLDRLVIDELSEQGSFLAVLELRPIGGGKLRRIDARPSDGMALAVRSGADIVVARQVVEKARRSEPDEPVDPPAPGTVVQTVATASASF